MLPDTYPQSLKKKKERKFSRHQNARPSSVTCRWLTEYWAINPTPILTLGTVLCSPKSTPANKSFNSLLRGYLTNMIKMLTKELFHRSLNSENFQFLSRTRLVAVILAHPLSGVFLCSLTRPGIHRPHPSTYQLLGLQGRAIMPGCI